MNAPTKWARAAALVSLVLGFAACGPKANIEPAFEQGKVQTLALLPIAVPEGTREERVRFLRSAFVSEMEARGYKFLDNAIVERYCADSNCARREELSERYPVDAFLEISISGIDRNNFVFGFYNAVVGEAVVRAPSGSVLATVSHTESKRGGLVFDSGQVIQALKEQYENYGDWGYNKLASAFAEEVAAELPAIGASGGVAAAAGPQIETIEVTDRSRSVHRICADGTPGLRAVLFINKRMTNLREVAAGRYCGVYRIEDSRDMKMPLEVELRSPFGEASRKSLQLENARRQAI